MGRRRREVTIVYILGIETSCDETSAAVIEAKGRSCRILSDVVASQIETHRLYGGVVPEIASRAHIEAISAVTREALDGAAVPLSEIGAVAVTAYPGLIGALLVGVNFAKSLAFANNIPLVPVNHIKAHTAAAYFVDPALTPPFLALVVSGGHTALFDVTSDTAFHLIGTTRDDAAGEAFDKIARVMGMPYPGGVAMDALAREGNPHAIHLPSPALTGEKLDFSFSGLKTAALNFMHQKEMRGEEIPRADLAASFTEAVVSGIAEKTAEALDRTGYGTLVLAGGVAANSHLRARLTDLLAARGGKCIVPPPSLCGDNGAMVAAAGYFAYLAGERAGCELNAAAEDEPFPTAAR